MVKWKRKEAVVVDSIFRLIVNTYSEDNRSRKGELTDVTKYAAVPFAELHDSRPPVLGSSYSQVKLPSLNYKGRKSELCVLGIEKRPMSLTDDSFSTERLSSIKCVTQSMRAARA
ncbi:hypothetical protein M9458_052177 [Cirrhinus mrigala]|uniref:Uncharacterized protein n=1 Tax=Cirrhinus mrigala TaxID=683832 RepID=A0ABD0MTV7_CIRMR